MEKEGFRVVAGHGFQMRFDNGWTVSVMFGTTNYCEHHGEFNALFDTTAFDWSSQNAEIAAWDSFDNEHKFEHDVVKGWVRPDEVAAFIHEVANLPKGG